MSLRMLIASALLVTMAPIARAESPLLAPAPAVPPTNPQASVLQFIGPTQVEVAFSRPGVKGRKIFGALVPYEHVWRTGADNATRIRFSTPVKLGGVDVPAGTYELFTIPRPNEWTVILQKIQQQWGSYSYDSTHDVARVNVKATRLAEPAETFTISFDDLAPNAATLNIVWDHTRS